MKSAGEEGLLSLQVPLPTSSFSHLTTLKKNFFFLLLGLF